MLDGSDAIADWALADAGDVRRGRCFERAAPLVGQQRRHVAQTVHDKFAGWMAEQTKAHMAAVARAVEQTHDDLVKDWGPVDSEAFRKNLAIADPERAALWLGRFHCRL